MPRPKLTVRPRSLHMHLPEDLLARLDLELYSELESRVPMNAYSRFFSDLLTKHFNSAQLNIGPYIGRDTTVITADKTTVQLIQESLNAITRSQSKD